jgi:hypothetical protein
MKKWLIKISIFLLPLFLYGAAFEWYCQEKTSFAIKREYALQHLAEFKVVFTGTSHIEKGIHITGDGYQYLNWAAPGQSFPFEFQLWKNYLKDMPQLQLAFIEISPTRWYLSPSAEDWSANIYWIHYQIPFRINRLNPRCYSHLLQDYAFFKNIVHTAWSPFTEKNTIDERGYAPDDFKDRFWNCQYDTAEINKSFIMKYDFKTKSSLLQENRNYLDSIIDLLQEHQVKPILVIPPFYSTFEKAIPAPVMISFEQWVQELRLNGHQVWDYRHRADWTVHDFYNDNHLNPEGAAKWFRALQDSTNRIIH